MLVGHLFRHFVFSPRAGSLVRRIAWLSMIGITISVTAFLIVLFIMNGMNASIKQRIIGLEPHLYVQVAGMTTAKGLETHPVFQRLKEHSENRADVYESMDLIVRSQDGQFRGALGSGVTQESLEHFTQQLQSLNNKKGMNTPTYYFDPEDIPGVGEIMMGVDLAQTLGVFEGDFVTIVSPAGLLLPPGETPKFERVRVKKIITTSLPDVDAQYIYYQRGKTLNALNNEGLKTLGIEVWLGDESTLADVKNDLLKFEDVKVETWMERNSALLYALKLEKLTIGIFLGLAGIIASTSILTVLALLLSQKRRDIAILRTIGFSMRQTILTFTKIGFVLAGTGVLTGVILGTGISLYIQKNPLQLFNSDIYYDSSIPALVDFWLVFGVLVVSTLIAWFGSYIPARTAVDIQPSDALRVK